MQSGLSHSLVRKQVLPHHNIASPSMQRLLHPTDSVGRVPDCRARGQVPCGALGKLHNGMENQV